MITRVLIFLPFLLFALSISGQDLAIDLIANDLDPHPMVALDKPEYLGTVVDPSFGTTIRRITDAGEGETITTMYSTIQAWNADETRMILYQRPAGVHLLLDGYSYQYLMDLDINPSDLEEVFWHFDDPDLLYYMDDDTQELIEYNVATETANSVADLRALTGCTDSMESGNDVQMMSWDSDVFSFRCGNASSWSYRISDGTLQEILVNDVQSVAAMPYPSGERYLHQKDVYNADGTFALTLDIASGSEHSCIGIDSEGNDLYYAIAFASSPSGGCLGEVIAYDPLDGSCRTIVGTELGYAYPQSGTHISALAHKHSEGGWLTASMIGYDQDGQDLLDQELIIARVTPTTSDVYRIGHHRADEDEYDYWGEPHPVISPSGTRVLFSSDWSGSDDGYAVDSYVVELPIFEEITAINEEILIDAECISVYPNPFEDRVYVDGISSDYSITILDSAGQIYDVIDDPATEYIDLDVLPSGMFFLEIINVTNGEVCLKTMLKE